MQKQNILSNCLVSMVKMLFFLVNYSLWLSLKVDLIGHLFSSILKGLCGVFYQIHLINYLCQDKISLYAANLKISTITNWWAFLLGKYKCYEYLLK